MYGFVRGPDTEISAYINGRMQGRISKSIQYHHPDDFLYYSALLVKHLRTFLVYFIGFRSNAARGTIQEAGPVFNVIWLCFLPVCC